MLPERTVRTIHVYKGVASVAAPAKMLETLMDETPHIFWIDVSRKKKGLSIDTMYIYIGCVIVVVVDLPRRAILNLVPLVSPIPQHVIVMVLQHL